MPPWVERHPKLREIWTENWTKLVAHGIDYDKLMELASPAQSQDSLNYDRVLKNVRSDIDKLIEDCKILSRSQSRIQAEAGFRHT